MVTLQQFNYVGVVVIVSRRCRCERVSDASGAELGRRGRDCDQTDVSLHRRHWRSRQTRGTETDTTTEIYRVGQKNGATDSWPQFCQILTDFKNNFTERFLSKFAVKCMLKIPPHLAYVVTLPCETLMCAKQAVNDKLQGSVATYLRCGGVVNEQIKKGLLLSLRVKKKSANVWQSNKQKRDCLVHFLTYLLSTTCSSHQPSSSVYNTIPPRVSVSDSW